MYNSMQAQSMCGPANGVPYSPQGGHNLPAAPPNAYNSLMGMSPYQAAAAYHHHQQQQQQHHAAASGGPIPLSSLMTGGQLPPSYKPHNMNDYEKACQQQLKSNALAANYGKLAPSLHQQSSAPAAQLNSHHHHPSHYPLAPAGQFSCPPEVLDRSSLGQVQFNAAGSHGMPPELMMNSARAGGLHPGAGPPPFALNYGGNKSRYVPNDVLLGNPNQLSQQQQAQTAMYLNHQQQQQHMHQQKQYYGGNNNKPNGAVGGGGGKFSNGGRGNGRRGGGNGGGGPNSNRKY